MARKKGITPTQAHYLRAFRAAAKRKPGPTLMDIAKEAERSESACSRMMARLASLGHLEEIKGKGGEVARYAARWGR